MGYYVQYDMQGNITATVMSDKPPVCANQLAFDAVQDISGKMIDLSTLTLIDAPEPQGDSPVDPAN